MTRKIKTVFIAHPIKGDIKGNIKKVLEICERVHSKTIIPVAPYLVSLQYLKDDIVEDRELGILANIECFHRRYIDELWLFGDRISKGMLQEIKLAIKLRIPIKGKTKATRNALRILIIKIVMRSIGERQKAEAYFSSLAKINKPTRRKK